MQTGGANPFMMPPTGQVIPTNTFLAGPTGMAGPMGGGASGLLLPGPQANTQNAMNRGMAPAVPGATSASNPFAQAMVTGGLDDLSVGALGIIPEKKQPGPQVPMRAMTGASVGSGPHVGGPSGGGSMMGMPTGGDPAQSGFLPPAAQPLAQAPAGMSAPAGPQGASAAADGASAAIGGGPSFGGPMSGQSSALPNAFMQQQPPQQPVNYAQVPPTGAPGQPFMPQQPQFQGSVTGFNNLPPQGQQPYYGGGFPGQAPNTQFYGGMTGPPAYGGGHGMPHQGYRPVQGAGGGFPGQSGQLSGHFGGPPQGQSGHFGGPPQGQMFQAAATGQPYGMPQQQMGHFNSSVSGPAAPWSNAFQ
jgi:hypothetical protein